MLKIGRFFIVAILLFGKTSSAGYCVLELIERAPSVHVNEAAEKQQRTRMWMDWFPDDRYIKVMPKTYFSPKYRMYTLSGTDNVLAFLTSLEGQLTKIRSCANGSLAYWCAGLGALGGLASYYADQQRLAAALAALATMALLTRAPYLFVTDQRLLNLNYLASQLSHFRAVAEGKAERTIASHVLEMPEDNGGVSLFLAVRRRGNDSQLFVLTPID